MSRKQAQTRSALHTDQQKWHGQFCIDMWNQKKKKKKKRLLAYSTAALSGLQSFAAFQNYSVFRSTHYLINFNQLYYAAKETHYHRMMLQPPCSTKGTLCSGLVFHHFESQKWLLANFKLDFLLFFCVFFSSNRTMLPLNKKYIISTALFASQITAAHILLDQVDNQLWIEI